MHSFSMLVGNMAGDEKLNSASGNNCKYCKKEVATTTAKCVDCEGVYHTSCALRVAGLIAIGKNNLVKCCVGRNEVKSPYEHKSEFEAFKKLVAAKDDVLASKDEIISQLKSKEVILHENIKLLKEKIDSKSGNMVPEESCQSQNQEMSTSASADNVKIIRTQNQNTKSQTESTRKFQIPNNINRAEADPSWAEMTKAAKNGRAVRQKQIQNPQQSVEEVTSHQVNKGILQAQTTNKLNEIIQLGQSPQHKGKENETSSGWNLYQRRRKRRFVVGKNTTSTGIQIQTVPKYTHLHVTRLSPTTTADELQRLLSTNFPGVQCEAHSSRYPEIYSSMKVTIRQDDLRNAWKSEIWPSGAIVSRFLMKKRVQSTPTDPQVTGEV